jgi:methylphosphotriester-DNA--protein-cysteine methyltransferase
MLAPAMLQHRRGEVNATARREIASMPDVIITATAKGQRHAAVIARMEALAAEPRRLALADICAPTGVCDRTLRAICQEYFGMGPMRYLWLKRMQQVRSALMQAPRTAYVTTIALDHGFDEFGRFSVEYRRLFGESPSVTLRRPPRDTSPLTVHVTVESPGASTV